MAGPRLKKLVWIASSLKDLQEFPGEIRSSMGYALYVAQAGGKHLDAKPLKGFHGAGVLEVVETLDGNTFRTVYTVRLADTVYVLHAFQKKARKGIATPKQQAELIRNRYEAAIRLHAARTGAGQGDER